MARNTHRDGSSRPTARQAEYLAFIRAFTARRGMPPSFEDIGRHFMTTPPSVNSMIKTLEARGFLTRIPGQARTLRVIIPMTDDSIASPTAARPRAAAGKDIDAAVAFSGMVIERLAPALKGASEEHLLAAFDAVRSALEARLLACGASNADWHGALESIRSMEAIALKVWLRTAPRNRRVRPTREPRA